MPELRNTACALALLAMVSACANPVVAPPVAPTDAQKSCAALEEDIARTAQLKRDARAEDRFQWKYVFMVNAGVSWHRMNKAEKAADARLQELNRIAASKGCLGNEGRVVAPVTHGFSADSGAVGEVY